MRIVLCALVAAMAVLLVAGCQESESSQIQRARLVGNENIQLKKQLAAKDAEIAQLKKDIEQLKADQAAETMKAGETNIQIMRIVAETEQQKAKLQAENTQLKAELEKLKTQ